MEQTQDTYVEHTEKQSSLPPLPAWPTSKPGPRVTEPPAGQKRVSLRTEQVIEVDYDQVLGKSGIRESEA